LLEHCGYFIIEISRYEDRLIVAAFDVETPNSYVMSAKGPRANQVLEDFECDFEKIASSLVLRNERRLCLQMPAHLIMA
jgi:hypothetical protein